MGASKNRLTLVTDGAQNTPPFADDVEGTETFAYDAIGNLIQQNKPNGNVSLSWNAYGKVRQVTQNNTQMVFGYDAQQNRLRKTVTVNGETKTSYYIRDAQGNALAVYERKGSSLIWKEQDLYGSSRLGMAKPEREVTGFFWQSASYTLVTGGRSYELSNHLGNVLAVVSDRGELQSAQDYFPFGMAMPGRSDGAYRYGFNGKETDPETGIQDYGMRWYLPNIARFPSVDPLYRKYPELTVYQFGSNTPIQGIDLDGLEIIHHWLQQAQKYSGFKQVIEIATQLFGSELIPKFKNGNLGVDMYILANKQEGNGLTTFYKASDRYHKDEEKNWASYKNVLRTDLFQYSQIMEPKEREEFLDFLINESLKKGKDIVVIHINEEFIKNAGTNDINIKRGIHTMIHEIEFHAIDFKDKKDDVPTVKEHLDNHNDPAFYKKNPTGKQSPPYEDIKPKSRAGQIKAKIESFFKSMPHNEKKK